VLTTIIDGRKRREIDPTIQLLRECASQPKHEAETPQEVKERITSMLEVLEEMSGWYDQIGGMPRPTLLKMMRMGARFAKAVS
jgi:DNA-binding transcriptional regulator GbsR (MarR family)